MQIFWVISSLGAGGVERVTTSLTRELADSGHDVCLATLARADRDVFAAAPAVQRVSLDLMSASIGRLDALARNAARVRALRRAIVEASPDVVVSFMTETNVVTLVASRGLGVPVVVSERLHPSEPHLSMPWKALRRLWYPTADLLVVPAAELALCLSRLTPRRPPVVIPNPLSREFLESARLLPNQTERTAILAVGRLTPQKDYPLLLRAFAQVARRFPRCELRVVGEGEERGRLERLARDLGVGQRVRWLGYRRDMVAEYDRATVFVLASRHEGFPNVLVEAMSRGLPVVSTDCPSGPADLVTDGVAGLLCPVGNVQAMADRVAQLLGSARTRMRLGTEALATRERLAPARIARQWERELRSLCAELAPANAARGRAVPVS